MHTSIQVILATALLIGSGAPLKIDDPALVVPEPEPVVVQVVKQKPVSTKPKKDYSPEALKKYATEQSLRSGFSEETTKKLLNVITCESGWKHTIKGDGGKAYSVGQFHRDTFHENKKGEESYYDAYHQIDVMIRMWNKGMQHRWTCYTKLYGK